MDDTYNEIDATLVPGMLDINVKEALKKAESLRVEMRESADLCKRLLDRLVFLRDYLPKRKNKLNSATEYAKVLAQFANTIGLVIIFLRKFSEKKLLQRIAANRLIIKDVERLHGKIDSIFRTARLANSSMMNEWKEERENDIAMLHSTLDVNLTHNPNNLVNDLTGSGLEEALTELKFEIDPRKNQSEFRDLLERVLTAVVEKAQAAQIPVIPAWFIRRDDVEIGDEIDMGSFGAVHKGKWGDEETEVVMKLLFLDGPDTQKSFLKEANVWHELNHPYVIKMLGGCHVGKPLFFVSEYAKHSNFTDYLYHVENKSKMWRLFHQAAQGLAYLHGKRIVHSDIKCNNILVGNDGTAKLCDFGFSYIRTLSLGKSIKEQPSATRWKAPECLLEQGPAANPSFKSDVFSLGMSIIEAKTGSVPWGVKSDDDIIEQLASEEGYPRPAGIFADKEWNLIRGMTEFEPEKRIQLLQVIEILGELANDQEAEDKGINPAVVLQFVQCWSCHENTPAVNKFCGECGVPLSKAEDLPKIEALRV